MDRQKIKELLTNYITKDVEFSYRGIKLILDGGYEIEIDAEYDYYTETHGLGIGVYQTKREKIGGTIL